MKNKVLFKVMKEINQEENPYSTGVAQNMDTQRDNIQVYIETMCEKGWINREKKGRKSILRFDWDEIASDYYLDVDAQKIQNLQDSPYQTLAEHLACSASKF